MPIYEYKCSRCAFQEEYLQKASEPQLTKCPSCGKKTFNKMLSAAGFQLKGSGWYATDFKGAGKKPASASSETRAESGGEPKSGANAESTAAAKTDKTDKSDAKPVAKSKPEAASA